MNKSNENTRASGDRPAAEAPESPFLIERLLRDAARADEDPNADPTTVSAEDEIMALAGRVDPDLPVRRMEALRNDPPELAQELAFQAYESATPEAALELADQALALHGDNADALTVRAFVVSEDAGELIEALEHAATCGEKELGEDFFAEYMGDFGTMVEARPYMRTLKQLAEVLWEVGRRFDAVACYENLLDLDNADHLGNALLLLGNYLSMGEVQRSWDLLEEHDDGEGAVFAWAWVLVFLLSDDQDAAADALDRAMDLNPYVAPWFIGMGGEPDRELDPVVPLGGEQEAQLCDQILGEAWDCASDAQGWLYDVLVDMGLVEPATDQDGETPRSLN